MSETEFLANSSEEESMSEDEDVVPKKRKGVKNTQLYKHNVIKRAKVKGLSHVNHAKKYVTERKTGKDCG